MVPTTQSSAPAAASSALPQPPILLCLPGPEVGGQSSEVSEEAPVGEEAAAAESPDLTSDVRRQTSAFSPEQRREKERLLDALKNDVREAVLLELAAHGEANVGQIAERIGVDQKTLSPHLTLLKNLDLLLNRREGRNQCYQINPDRVRYQRQSDEHFTLMLLGRSRNVFAMIGVPAVSAAGRFEPQWPADGG